MVRWEGQRTGEDAKALGKLLGLWTVRPALGDWVVADAQRWLFVALPLVLLLGLDPYRAVLIRLYHHIAHDAVIPL